MNPLQWYCFSLLHSFRASGSLLPFNFWIWLFILSSSSSSARLECSYYQFDCGQKKTPAITFSAGCSADMTPHDKSARGLNWSGGVRDHSSMTAHCEPSISLPIQSAVLPVLTETRLQQRPAALTYYRMHVWNASKWINHTRSFIFWIS